MCVFVSVASVFGADEPGPKLGQSAGRAGLGYYKPGMWGIVGLPMSNRSDKAFEVVVANSLSGDAETQFCTKIWVPARSQRRIWQAVRIPNYVNPKDKSVGIETILFTPTPAGDRQLGREESLLRVEEQTPTSALVADPMDETAGKMVVAARLSANWSQRLTLVNMQEMPYFAPGMEMLDTLTIAASNPDMDAAQITAIRDWLAAGGRLWITLDTVSPEFCSRLLRESWDLRVVDKVGMSRVTIAGFQPTPAREFDEPITFARVLPGSMRVIHTINGWPASMSMRFGKGEVLVTTLAAQGWYDNADRALPSLEQLGGDHIKPRERETVELAALKPYLAGQIGYGIVGRGTILGVMAVVVIAIAGAGIFFRLRQHGEWTALVSVGLAVLAAAVFILMGSMKRNEVPLTIADGQFVQVIQGQPSAIVRGVTSVYSPHAGDANLQSRHGGVGMPEPLFHQGKLVRMVWTDFDQWHFDGLRLPSGDVRSVEYKNSVDLPSRATATGTFSNRGFECVVSGGGLEGLEQALLVTSVGHGPATASSGASYTIEPVKPGDTAVMLGAVTSQTVARRRDLLKRFAAEPRAPDEPALLVWGKSLPVVPGFIEEGNRKSSALYELPITLTRPPAGTAVKVPWMFVPFKELRQSKDGLQPVVLSPLYNPQTREWAGSMTGGVNGFYMRFTPPQALMPFKPTLARVTFDIAAPKRLVQIGVLDGTTVRELQSFDSPNGVNVIELAAAQLESIDHRNGIVIRIKVNQSLEDDSLAGSWMMKGVWMELEGVTGGLSGSR